MATRRALLLILIVFLCMRFARAESGENLSFSYEPWRSAPQYNLEPLESENRRLEAQVKYREQLIQDGREPASITSDELERAANASNAGSPDISVDASLEPRGPDETHWARPAAGIWVNLTNSGVSSSLLRISTDDVLLGNASEFGFGFGGFFDLAFPGVTDQGFRFKLGYQRMGISPSSSVSAISSTLEDGASVLHASVLYRFTTGWFRSVGTFWYGLGGHMNYVFATNMPVQSATGAVSKVQNSYGFNLIGAFGVDLPISDWNDATFEADYHPITGFSIFLGVRTSL